MMRRLLVALGMVALAACSDSTGPGGIGLGTYSLVSLNNQSVPITLGTGSDAGGTYRVELYSGSVQLNGDGSFRDIATFRYVYQSSGATDFEADTTEGEYDVRGDVVTFQPYDFGADTYEMTFSGRTLTQFGFDNNLGNYTLVYRR